MKIRETKPFAILLWSLLLLSYGSAVANKNVVELANPQKTNAKLWATQKQQPLYASFVNKDVRFAKQIPPTSISEKTFWGETAWRGEHIGTQLLLWSGVGVEEVKISFSDLETPSGEKLSATNFKVGVVRYMMSNHADKSGQLCGKRQTQNIDSLLVADLIEYNAKISVQPKTVQPLWITLDIPANAKPGKYNGVLSITTQGAVPVKIEFTTHFFVREHLLPPPGERLFGVDFWINPYAVSQFRQCTPWSSEHFEAMTPMVEKLALMGQKNITVPLTQNVFEGSFNDGMLSLIKRIDGSWTYDFTKFDLWVEYMMSKGIRQQISCIVNADKQSITYYDQAENNMQDLSLKVSDPLFANIIKALTQHLVEKGWMDKSMLCVQNASKEQLEKLIKVANSTTPAWKISHTGALYSNLVDSLAQCNLSMNVRTPLPKNSAQQRSNLLVTCSAPVVPVFVNASSAAMPWFCWYAAANQRNGITHTHYNNWSSRPLLDLRNCVAAAGYTALTYPGNRTSIRIEQLLEGIQDIEKLRLLEKQFADKKDAVSSFALQKILEEITLETLNKKPIATIVEKAHVTINSL